MMKRTVSILLILTVVCGMLAASVLSASAATPHMDDWYYYINSDGTANIVSYEGHDTVLQIPPAVNDRAVVELESGVFDDERARIITEVTIPDGVVTINRTFAGCEALERVTIPDSVTDIFEGFNGCCSLQSIVIPDSVSAVSGYCFNDCRSLKHVTLGSGVSDIGKNAFLNCINLREIYIPPTVTWISDENALGYGRRNTPAGAQEIYQLDLTIKGQKGSAAEAYAEKHGFTFVEADEDVILYPDAPAVDTRETVYVNLHNHAPRAVYKGDKLDVVLYAVSLTPIGQIDGTLHGHGCLSDLKICASAEEDGALMEGSVTDGSIVHEFDIHAATDDVTRFERFIYTDRADTTVYVQPIISMTLHANQNPINISLYVRHAYDIYGRLLRDSGKEFTDSYFYYDLIVSGDEIEIPFLPAQSDTPRDILRGDADSDGKVSVLDATRIQRYLAGMIGEDGLDITAADADLDGKITVLDATRIQRVLASMCDMDGKTPEVPAPGMLLTPHINKIESSNSGVEISWGAVPGAEGYRVFIKNGDSWQQLGDTTASKFTHTDAAYHTECTYTVRCISADGSRFTSDFDREGYANTRLRTPALKSAVLLDGLIGVSWDKVPSADAYRVYIKGGEYSSWKRVGDTALNYYDVNTSLLELDSGTKYSFTVRCIDRSSSDRLSSGFNPSGVSVTYYDTPFIYAVVNTVEGLEYYWTEVEGVSKYRVFEWTENGWKKLTDTADTAILITGLQRENDYRITVRGMNAGGSYITSYDNYGRMAQWMPDRAGQGSGIQTGYILRDMEYSIRTHGFITGKGLSAMTDESMLCLLDSNAFYYDTSVKTRDYISYRGLAKIDWYVDYLKRRGEQPSDYYAEIMTQGDYDGFIWFYLVLTPVHAG